MHQLLKKRDHDRAMREVSIGRVEGATGMRKFCNFNLKILIIIFKKKEL